MKTWNVISLNPPYGTLIAACHKRPDLGKHIETRGQNWNYRGPLLIHQTKGLGEMFEDEEDLQAFCEEEPFRSTLAALGITRASQLPRGAIVAKTYLYSCRPTAGERGGSGPKYADWVHALDDRERLFGNYAPGRYGLLLAEVEEITPPIPTRGMLGMWTWKGEL